jgi:hypothetical protein
LEAVLVIFLRGVEKVRSYYSQFTSAK